MHIQPFYDESTATFTYVVHDTITKHCAIIDPVLDYDADSGRTSTVSADKLIHYVHQNQLLVEWLLETHPHADHLSAAAYLKSKYCCKTGIGENIIKVLEHWVPVFNTQSNTPLDGSQFSHLFKAYEEFSIGQLTVTVIPTPGHTPACISYLINDAIFVGDALFMPYFGTARTDFPGGSAQVLYESIQTILALPESTRIFTGHDYPPEGQKPRYESTVKIQKAQNILINHDITKSDYIALRNQRDKSLPIPHLLLPAIQVNLRAGFLGEPEHNHIAYLKIPINQI